MHEAFAAAVEFGNAMGCRQARAWLISTGKFKAINGINRQRRLTARWPIASR